MGIFGIHIAQPLSKHAGPGSVFGTVDERVIWGRAGRFTNGPGQNLLGVRAHSRHMTETKPTGEVICYKMRLLSHAVLRGPADGALTIPPDRQSEKTSPLCI